MANNVNRPGDPYHMHDQPSRQRSTETSRTRKTVGESSSRRQRIPAYKRSSSRWFSAVVMVLITVGVSVFLAIFIIQSANDLFGLNQEDNPIMVTIPEGAGLGEATEILSKAGVVNHTFTFRIYANIRKDEESNSVIINPGEYPMNTNMGYDQVLTLLRNGNTADQIVRITFIEGMTLVEIAKELEDNNVCDAEDLIEYLDTTEFKHEFYNKITPVDPLRHHTLEGYIFPDTYDFYVPESPGHVAAKFLDNFEKRISDDMQKRMQDIGLTLDETITLASVIQKEAGDGSNMRRVSSVFHNRLDASETYPKLQSDVTLLYVETDIKPYLQFTNQDMYDAYNTYVREGLPVGPISNPGLEAITAALYPAETEYYFFVTDVNEEFYYATTASEHYQKVAYAAAQDKEGKGTVHGIATIDQ